MHDHELSRGQQLIDRSRRARDQAEEAIASAKETIARSLAIMRRAKDDEQQPAPSFSVKRF